jgi:hypothetical protein
MHCENGGAHFSFVSTASRACADPYRFGAAIGASRHRRVVSGFGGGAGKDGFIEFIREGGPRKTMILSEARVRLYGETAVVTTHLTAAGPFVTEVNGKVVRKCFDVKKRQTDVLVWENGGWKSVLLHETVIPPGPKVTNTLSDCT